MVGNMVWQNLCI